MRRYGSDKPDLRFDLETTGRPEYFASTPFRVFQAPYVGAIVMAGGGSQARRQLDAWQEWAKQRGAKGLAYVLIGEDGTLGGPVAKNLSEAEKEGLRRRSARSRATACSSRQGRRRPPVPCSVPLAARSPSAWS